MRCAVSLEKKADRADMPVPFQSAFVMKGTIPSELNDRAENSHQPFRRRERAMLCFRRMRSLQKDASRHGQVHNHFNRKRHLTSRQIYEDLRDIAFTAWRTLGPS